MAPMIPIASQEKFDSISPVRSNGQAINLELQYRGGGGGDDSDGGDQLQNRRLKRGSSDRCTISMAHSNSGGAVDVYQLPAETHKTLLCLALLLVAFVANLLSVAIMHDHTPATKQDANRSHPPLRDITYDIASSAPILRDYQPLLMAAAELSVVATTAYVLGAVVLCHPHRSIVFRRLCFLLALLFGLRLLTMNVTMLPVSSGTLYRCAAKERTLVLGVIAARLFDLVAHLGLWADGDVGYCGNYVFSGHAALLVLNCLWVDEYGSPRRRLVRLLMKMLAAGSLLSLIMIGFDYTISIITAYYATTRIFWIYHTMANNESLKKRHPVNQVCKEWWYSVFQYLEGNVRTIVSTPNSNKF